MYKGTNGQIFVAFFPELPQAVTVWMYIFDVLCYKETEWLLCLVCYCTEYCVYSWRTVCNWTVLTVITQRQSDLFWAFYRTAHLLYKYCTNCTVCRWTVLTVITHKLPLHVQLQNSALTVSWCLLKYSAAACSKLYSHTYPEIRSFRLALLAASAVTQFDSDKKQMDVTMTTDKLCKLKANSDNFILKCRFVWKFAESYRILQ